MKRILTAGAFLFSSFVAHAAEPQLNELPSILFKLRGCSSSILGGTSCQVKKEDLWASVDSEGNLTLFRKRSYGDTTYANGKNISELLKDFAAKINNDQAANKLMLEALAPYLQTQ